MSRWLRGALLCMVISHVYVDWTISRLPSSPTTVVLLLALRVLAIVAASLLILDLGGTILRGRLQNLTSAIRKRDERHRAFVSENLDAIWTLELDAPCRKDWSVERQVDHIVEHGYISECNDAMAAMYGAASCESLIGARFKDLACESSGRHRACLTAFVEGGYHLRELETRDVDETGAPRYFSSTITGIVENGSLTRAWVLQRDTTDRRVADQILHAERDFTSAVLDTVGSIVFVLDRFGRVVRTNKACDTLTGMGMPDVGGQAYWDCFVPPHSREQAMRDFGRLTAASFPWNYEGEIVTETGGSRLIQWSNTALFDAAGAIEYVICSGIDITEHHRAQEALVLSQDRYELAVRGSSDGIWDWDLQTGKLYFSPRCRGMLGYEESDSLDAWQDLVHPDDLPLVMEELRAYCDGEKPNYEAEFRIRHRRGYYQWILARGVGLRDENGCVTRMAGSHTDIAGRKAAEESLSAAYAAVQESERQFRTLVANVPGAIYRCQVEKPWEMAYLSDAIYPISGYTAQEFCGPDRRTFASIMHPDDLPRVEDEIASAIAERRQYSAEYRILHANGSVCWVYEVGQAHFEEDRAMHLDGAIFDITGQKLALERLRESDERFLQLSENIDAVFWIRDPIARRPLYLSPAFEKIWGQSRESLLSGRLSFLDTIHADDRPSVAAAKAKQEVEGYDILYRVLRPDGGVCWVRDRAFPIRDETGVVHRVVGIAEDVTESQRTQRELIAAREAAIESVRLKSEFLANMSHEIRTPMNGVIGVTELLLDTDLTAEQAEFARTIRASADTLLTVINDILDFSKIEAGRMEIERAEFSLEQVIEDVANLLRPKASEKGIELRVEPGTVAGARLLGDPTRISQVLTNLAGNAVKFTDAGTVTIRTERTKLGEEELVRITVEDTGIGIEEDRLAAIFDSFTQADGSMTRRYGGTGLGLTIVKQLVELMSGAIRVESEPGKGSRFIVEIPLRFCQPGGEPSNDVEERPRQATSSGYRPKVLVVEDNPVNRLVAQRQLEKLGVDSDLAENGRIALDLLAASDYDLVFMDIQMPEMDGVETTRNVRMAEAAGRKRTVIIAVTAHAMQEDRARCLDAGMDDYVSKPLKIEALVQKLERWCPRYALSNRGVEGAQSIDEKRLSALSGGDAEFESQLIEAFLTASPSLIDELKEAVSNRSLESALQAISTLKGSSSSIGAETFAQACAALEQAIAKDQWSASASMAHELASQYASLERSLRGRVRPAA